jgi:hypothetical protein
MHEQYATPLYEHVHEVPTHFDSQELLFRSLHCEKQVGSDDPPVVAVPAVADPPPPAQLIGPGGTMPVHPEGGPASITGGTGGCGTEQEESICITGSHSGACT